MGALTDWERYFLLSQRIAEDEVSDCSDISPRRYKAVMEYEDKLFALVLNPCGRGHRIRSRSGHCIVCDTSRIAFTRRHYKPAYVYIAGSMGARVFKIGSTISPGQKDAYLNSRRYGGITDWKLLYFAKFPDAGKVEFEIHRRLERFATSLDGRREIFACAYVTAKGALQSASSAQPENEWEHYRAKYQYRFISYLLPKDDQTHDPTPPE